MKKFALYSLSCLLGTASGFFTTLALLFQPGLKRELKGNDINADFQHIGISFIFTVSHFPTALSLVA